MLINAELINTVDDNTTCVFSVKTYFKCRSRGKYNLLLKRSSLYTGKGMKIERIESLHVLATLMPSQMF